MTDQVSPINQEPIQAVSEPTRAQRLKEFVKAKKVLIGIVCAIVVILIVVVVLLVVSGGTNIINLPGINRNGSGGNKSGSLNQSEYKEKVNLAAQEVLFVDALKRPDGFYNYVYDYDAQCVEENGAKTCPFGGVDMFETTNTWAALANFAAYEISGDQKYLNQSVADLQKLNEYCAKDREQCLWVLVQPSLIYGETKNPEILAFLRAQAPVLKSSPLSQNNLMLAAIQVRSMFMIGELLNDASLISLGQTKLPELSQRLIREPNLYTEPNPLPQDEKIFGQYTCWVALANLYNPDANFADIQAFLDNGQITENFEYFNNPIDIQPCIEAYFVLSEKTGNTALKDYAVSLQVLANNAFFDGRGDMKKVYGNGGYLINKVGNDPQRPGLMVLTDAAYAAYLQSLEIK